MSRNSVESSWVKKELNSALVHEIERRKVAVLPIKLDDVKMPDSINDKLYADFRGSYEEGLKGLLQSIKAREVTEMAETEKSTDDNTAERRTQGRDIFPENQFETGDGLL